MWVVGNMCLTGISLGHIVTFKEFISSHKLQRLESKYSDVFYNLTP